MTVPMFIYRSLRKTWLSLFYNPFCRVFTLMAMCGHGVRHGRFKTNGAPIFRTYRHGGGIISLGENLRMNNGQVYSRIGFTTRCTFTADGANIYVHQNVGMSQSVICAVGADITIGSNTLLGSGVRIYSSNFHSLNYVDRRDGQADRANRKSAPVFIGEDCFIGAGTVILKGVIIGDRTIIGAGSVVTKSIPADCIAAGNPCKIIKHFNHV